MKNILYSALIMVFSLSSCTPQKKLVATTPFQMGEATCQSWVGGRPESGSGIRLNIPMLSEDMQGVQFQQVYFRGKVTDLKMKTEEGKKYATANFLNNPADKPDIIMDADAKKEVGNRPPELKDEFPFELQPTECVISYLDGDTIKYHKVEGVKELKQLIYK